MEGWDIRVMVPQLSDPRPLEILGAGVGEREQATIDIERFDHNPYLCRCETGSLHVPVAEAVLWTTDEPAQGAHLRFEDVHHRLSAAAQAFKSHALAAAGSASEVRGVESFRIATACSSIAAIRR